MPINQSVGDNGANQLGDVLYVQLLLADWQARTGANPIAVDGSVGPMTIAAIRAFQAANTGVVDGRVDPGGPALAALEQFHIQALKQDAGATSLPAQVPVPGLNPAPLPATSSPDTYFQQYLETLRAGMD